MERTHIKEELLNVLKRFIVKKLPQGIELTEDATLRKDLKIDSADMIDIVLEIEERFSIKVDDEQLDRVKTLGEMVSLIQGLAA